MSIKLEELWHKTLFERTNCEAFIEMLQKAKDITYKHSASAPWQVDVTTRDGGVISFWPHKMRAVEQKTYTAHDFTTWEDALSLFDTSSRK